MIIRRKRMERFTIVDNRSIEGTSLSYDTLGLLTYLLSRPNDWEVQIEQLKTRGGIGKHKIYKLLGELKDAGYIVHEQDRSPHSKAFGAGRYIVYDEAQRERCSPDLPLVQEPHPENQEAERHPDSPDAGKPHPENRDAYKV